MIQKSQGVASLCLQMNHTNSTIVLKNIPHYEELFLKIQDYIKK